MVINTIFEMTYPGEKDYILHFNKYLKAFKDKRYITVDGKLLFVIFAPMDMPDFPQFKKKWNELAVQNGLKGFHFVGVRENFTVTNETTTKGHKYSLEAFDKKATKQYKDVLNRGFDGINSRGSIRANVKSTSLVIYYIKRFLMKLGIRILVKCQYKDIISNYYVEQDRWENVYPTIIPNFDRSPRSGWKTNILWYGSTPTLFKKHIIQALNLLEGRSAEHKILFLQSWNEWGEGNYVEPDLKFGHAYLEVLREVIR